MIIINIFNLGQYIGIQKQIKEMSELLHMKYFPILKWLNSRQIYMTVLELGQP